MVIKVIDWWNYVDVMQIPFLLFIFTIIGTVAVCILVNYATDINNEEHLQKQAEVKNNLMPNWSLENAMRVNRETCCSGASSFTPAERETYKNMLKDNSVDTGVSIFEPHDVDIISIAKNADFIVNGYAFTSENNQVRVLNLNNHDKATVLDKNGEVLMTSMDDIEISIIQKYFERNKVFLKSKD